MPRGLRGRRGAEVPESEGGAGELRQLRNESGVVGLAEVVYFHSGLVAVPRCWQCGQGACSFACEMIDAVHGWP